MRFGRATLSGALLGLASACTPAPALPPGGALPARLSEVGLYDDLRARSVTDDARPYSPRYPLWSDGVEKRRWLDLPPGGEIDRSDPDRWQFPVGTRAYKEFSLGPRPLETRVMWRVADTGRREDDTLFGTYVWQEDGADARLAVDGVPDVLGTSHDVPSGEACWLCHLGESGHVLGVSALQLDEPEAASPTLDPAIGYLHGNCGHCHNPRGRAWSDTDLVLRIGADGDTRALVASVLAPMMTVPNGGPRVRAGAPEHSPLLERAAQRGTKEQMPPLGSERVDEAAIEVLRRWIRGL